MKNSLPLFLAFACLLCSCVDPLEMLPDGSRSLPSNSLAISPSVLGATIATKTAGVDELGENTINTLDVYVYEKTVNGSEITLTFFKRYHFTKNSTTLSSGTDVLLESNWRNEPVATRYSPSKKYRIYAIANSRHSATEREKNLTWDELMALSFTSPQTVEISGKKYGYDIIRLKGEVPSPADNQDLHIAEKDFVMDGMVDDWQIVDSSEPQYITEYPNSTSEKYRHFELKRAAAKFHVTLTFGDFINSKADPDDPNNPNKRIVTKLWWPSFKFSNFMVSSHDVKPSDTYPDPKFRDAHLWDSDDRFNFTIETPIEDPAPNPEQRYTYELTTYSYAFNWKDKEEGADVSPSLLFSMGYSYYKQEREDAESEWVTVAGSETDREFHYYRIPLIDLDTHTAVDRNTYYQVTAQINSKGAKTVDTEEPTDVFLMYKVIPWPGVSDMVTEAQTVQLEYFVAEMSYRLRGDGEETTFLQYFTPKSDPIGNTGYNQATPKITRVKVYYNDQNGNERPLYTEWTGSVYEWTATDGNVSIKVRPSSSHNGGGNFQVTSTSLASRAVKYIEFDTEVDFEYLYNDGQTTHKVTREKIIVTHFPLDNIQSILGWWSSRWDGSSTSIQVPEYSWEQQTGWTAETVYVSYADYQSDQTHYSILNDEQRQNNRYTGMGLGQYDWGSYTSLATSYFSSDGWCYWRTGNYWDGYTYHKICYGGTRYVHYYSVDLPSTGNWVAYDPLESGTNYDFGGGRNGANNGRYYAKVKYEGYTYNLNENGTPGSQQTLNNNHMYVIQISKAESGVILGRPSLDGYYQSQDNVVSPAFMIASQLGAATTFHINNNEAQSGRDAARHCHSYMEVDQNGRRFVGWRLPTAAEINYIVGYQSNNDVINADVFDIVLTGTHYYTLDGNVTEAGGPTSGYGARCVRDLTPKEVIELNETGTITDASY